jgi:hypothetical protein
VLLKAFLRWAFCKGELTEEQCPHIFDRKVVRPPELIEADKKQRCIIEFYALPPSFTFRGPAATVGN